MASQENDVTWAMEILTPDPNQKESFMGKIWGPFLFSTLGFGAVCFVNWGSKKPVFSGIQKHALAIAAGMVGGKYWDEYRKDYLAERDAVLRHYIQLHPEDFPAPERKKWGDLLEPWIPVR